MQQFRRTLLRIFMMLFLVAGVSTFVTVNANAVYADELESETSEETKVEAIVEDAAAAEVVAEEVSEVQEDAITEDVIVTEDAADSEVVEDLQAEAEEAVDTAETEVTEEVAETPAAEVATEEVKLATKHLTVLDGVDYSLVYDYEYFSANQDVYDAFGDDEEATLRNFVRWGMLGQRQGIATFDVVSYRYAYADLRRAYGTDYTKYYLHYMKYGYSEGRDQVTGITELQNTVTTLNGVDYSLVYDYKYFSANEDVYNSFGDDDVATLANFVRWGMEAGRQGIATFDAKSYRLAYADLRAAYGTNYPSYYLHYMKWGYGEGRDLVTGITQLIGGVTVQDGIDYALVYDFNYFQTKYPDVRDAFGDDDVATLANFVRWGMAGERQGIATFDEKSYRYAYASLRRTYGTNYAGYYLHYIRWGYAAGLDQTTGVTQMVDPVTKYVDYELADIYDYEYYKANNADAVKACGDDDQSLLEYFVKTGIVKGEKAKASYDTTEYNNFKTIFTGFANATTKYQGLEMSMVYDFYYYYEKYSDLRAAYGADTAAYIAHFARWGTQEWRQAKASFRSDVYDMFRQTFVSSSQLAMDQKAQNYSSSTKYLILINYTYHYTNVYEKIVDGAWTKIHTWQNTMGADATPTPTGEFTISDRVYYFDSGYSRCFYATRVSGSIMIHSVLYYQNAGPTQVMDGTLGANISHGCIRHPLEGCKWIYYNIPAGTKCVIYR